MGDINPRVGVRPEDVDAAGQQPATDADELPEHERDELRRRTAGQSLASDPAAEAGLPEHEQDAQRGHDTGGQPENP